MKSNTKRTQKPLQSCLTEWSQRTWTAGHISSSILSSSHFKFDPITCTKNLSVSQSQKALVGYVRFFFAHLSIEKIS